MSEPREFDFVPLKTCSAISGGKAQSGAEISKTENMLDKITSSSWDSDFAGDPVSKKSTTGLVAQINNHTVKIWIDVSELDRGVFTQW